MKDLERIALAYFRPKTIEFWRGKTIYDLVGIRIYKKYLPSSGDIVRRWRNIKHIKLDRANRVDELYKYERKTRNYEWRHIVGVFLFILFSYLIDRKFTLYDWLFVFFLNLMVNIYPIFLQRYNRIRIITTIQKGGQSSPYEMKSVKQT